MLGLEKGLHAKTDLGWGVDEKAWWPDFPNLRREVDRLLPVIRQPHWTSWKAPVDSPDNLRLGTSRSQGRRPSHGTACSQGCHTGRETRPTPQGNRKHGLSDESEMAVKGYSMERITRRLFLTGTLAAGSGLALARHGRALGANVGSTPHLARTAPNLLSNPTLSGTADWTLSRWGRLCDRSGASRPGIDPGPGPPPGHHPYQNLPSAPCRCEGPRTCGPGRGPGLHLLVLSEVARWTEVRLLPDRLPP